MTRLAYYKQAAMYSLAIPMRVRAAQRALILGGKVRQGKVVLYLSTAFPSGNCNQNTSTKYDLLRLQLII